MLLGLLPFCSAESKGGERSTSKGPLLQSLCLFGVAATVYVHGGAGQREAQEAQQVAVHAHNLEAQAHAHAEAQVQAAVQAHSLAAKAQAHAHAQVCTGCTACLPLCLCLSACLLSFCQPSVCLLAYMPDYQSVSTCLLAYLLVHLCVDLPACVCVCHLVCKRTCNAYQPRCCSHLCVLCVLCGTSQPQHFMAPACPAIR